MKKYFKIIFLLFIFFESCDSLDNSNSDIYFGEGKYNEPFRGSMESVKGFLEPSLNWPILKWFRTDTITKDIVLLIDVNEDAFREKSQAKLIFADSIGNNIKGIDFRINGQPINEYTFIADSLEKKINVSAKLQPNLGNKEIIGQFYVISETLDTVNNNPINNGTAEVGTWKIKQKIGWALWPWFWWILAVIAVIAIILILIYGLIKFIVGFSYPLDLLPKLKFSNQDFDYDKKNKRKKKKKRKMKDQILEWEKQLYQSYSTSDKYDILEKIRLALDNLYENDRERYNYYEKTLKPNTWEALEDNWTLWNPVPKNNAEWIGPDNMTCNLKPSHPNYPECAGYGLTQCTYDEHGSPNFDKVTFPGSVVDISDLYDSLSSDNIQKRGGSPNSLQEIAQMRMVPKLKKTIQKWAKETGNAEDFWEWRNAMNLVPHEDTNCRTMRLVYRPVHIAFKHRGGVANAVNIKNHFG